MAKTEAANYIKVTQVKSAIGRIEPQKRTIKALGLGKISSSSVLPDNPAVRGMVASVAHLVSVEAAEKPLTRSISSTRKLKGRKTAKAEIMAKAVAPEIKETKVEVKPVAAKTPAVAKAPAAKKPAAAKKPVAAKKPAPKKTTPKKETP
jgi:large subunit ribosomal protein L30